VLEAGAALLAYALPGPHLPAPASTEVVHAPAGSPVAPGTPAECLLPHTSRAQASSQTAALGPLTAVVLGVVVGAELEAVVAPADQVAPAAPVSVILAAVPGPVTVPLPLPTRGLRSAAPLAVEVSPSTSLTCRRLEGNPGRDLRQRLRSQEGLRKVAAIILWVIVCSKLLAVVASTHQFSLTSSVTIIGSPVQGPVTVSLAIAAGLLGGAATPTIEVPAGASLTCRRFCQWVAGGTQSLAEAKSRQDCQQYYNLHPNAFSTRLLRVTEILTIL